MLKLQLVIIKRLYILNKSTPFNLSCSCVLVNSSFFKYGSILGPTVTRITSRPHLSRQIAHLKTTSEPRHRDVITWFLVQTLSCTFLRLCGAWPELDEQTVSLCLHRIRVTGFQDSEMIFEPNQRGDLSTLFFYTPNSKKVALGIGNWALGGYCLGIRKQ